MKPLRSITALSNLYFPLPYSLYFLLGKISQSFLIWSKGIDQLLYMKKGDKQNIRVGFMRYTKILHETNLASTICQGFANIVRFIGFNLLIISTRSIVIVLLVISM